MYTDAMYEPGKPAGMAFVIKAASWPQPVAGYLAIPDDLMRTFLPKATHIQQGETLAVALPALCDPPLPLQSLDVLAFIDNLGALACLVKGHCADCDSSAVSTMAHLLYAKLRTRLYFEWVESQANIIDEMSRTGMPTFSHWLVANPSLPQVSKLSDLTLGSLERLFT